MAEECDEQVHKTCRDEGYDDLSDGFMSIHSIEDNGDLCSRRCLRCPNRPGISRSFDLADTACSLGYSSHTKFPSPITLLPQPKQPSRTLSSRSTGEKKRKERIPRIHIRYPAKSNVSLHHERRPSLNGDCSTSKAYWLVTAQHVFKQAALTNCGSSYLDRGVKRIQLQGYLAARLSMEWHRLHPAVSLVEVR